ncbi:RNA-binding protein [Grosmannia clavigera kw1407]|uniref:RNA-binding protein n=1 Tax=Grosmannia clavigera (strain kw1407 / UAMH 11150) TaxID=655863 RepID=F0XFN5_GROCL|nr:RNA-binding protein [Grosmannia clavigera kw1407]EFX03585.1 RNA-binding protein [Grosmannia clavigera kw1407]
MATETETKIEVARPPAVEDVADDVSSHGDDQPAKKKSKRKASTTDLPELEVDVSLPEPPSKRAKRALKKGKPLPPRPNPLADSKDDAADDDGAGKSGKNGKNGKPSKERSQFGVWIGNLAFTVTRTQLFQWLVESSGGTIAEADITRVNLPTSSRRPGQPPRDREAEPAGAAGGVALAVQNKGFAYVDFATYEAQVAAAALSETELDGRRVLIKDSKSFDGRPAKPAAVAADGETAADKDGSGAAAAASAGAASSTATKVFVGNLGFETTEEDLRRHFAPCGTIAWAKVATFPDNTEKCRGYGWVQFGLPEVTDGTQPTPAEAAASAVLGFVRIKEAVDTEEDFVAEALAAEANKTTETDEAAATATTLSVKPKEARFRTRKWWVNMLKGRTLKVQFAEDDQARYKKRFGKDRPQKQLPQQQQRQTEQPQTQHKRPRQEKWQDKTARNEEAAAPSDKPFKFQDLSIAQRTGAVTASLGKKTMLE